MSNPPSSKYCPAFGGGAYCQPSNGICIFCRTPLVPLPTSSFGAPGARRLPNLPTLLGRKPPAAPPSHPTAAHARIYNHAPAAQAAHAHALATSAQAQNAAHARAYAASYAAANGHAHPYLSPHQATRPSQPPSQISHQHALAAQHIHQPPPPASAPNPDPFEQYHPQLLTPFDRNAAIPPHLVEQWVGQARRSQPLPPAQAGHMGCDGVRSDAWTRATLAHGKSRGGSGLDSRWS